MINSSVIKKYLIDFLIVFIGILSSFGIDNYLKNVQRENQKNILLDELLLSINDDIIQLKIVNDALDDCLKSIDILFEQSENKTLTDSILAFHISNVSAKTAISFFPQKGAYNQLLNTNSFELIEDNIFRRKISDLYEHLEDRKNAADLKFDFFIESFDKALLDKINYRLKIEELDNSVSINTIIYDFNLPKNLFNDFEFLGYLSNAEKRVYMYKELMKKYSQSMNEISSYLENLKNK